MDQYEVNTQVNLQNHIQFNKFNTKVIIVIYLIFCAIIGFSIDILQGIVTEDLSLTWAIKSLILFGRPIYAAKITILLGIFVLFFFYAFHNKIIRLGLHIRNLFAQTNNDCEKVILEEYRKIGKAIGLKHLPPLWVAEHEIVNAFCSGYNEKTSVVVVTRGLIERLTLPEIKAVLAVELYHIKFYDTQIIQAVSFISNGLIIFFDTFYYRFLYGKKKIQDMDFFERCFRRFLMNIRFTLPVFTFLYRFILNPNRIHYAHIMATRLLGDNQSLISALIKVRDAHHIDKEEVATAYSEISHDEIRREAYFFDPANFNLAQTFSTPFSTQPSIEMQIEKLEISINLFTCKTIMV
ncbi:M48 family metalloprotease [Legionella parisiensis]|uniref:Peptidase M48 domain-containing protein n=1 Tax=Legionella parisiensis TaxID=45071 RepID=A0A1E5JV89_9GAMM|nr:M48 family metalloprotease [Legionella parisiensis]KTD43089.1 heat shock protein HtpX [Legionella parisiensis]OEH47968.1 hypothetical protein lpari_00992 [Legionella parisiensis]STX77832.1 Zn-dependent protease with chaperone function [Legionella parisiensis]